MENIGFIGFGIMGRPMAVNIRAAGYTLYGWARRQDSIAPALVTGIQACASAADVAARSDIVFTMVSDTPDVEAVIFGADGLIEQARPGSVVVDMSTISALATRDMAARLAAKDIAMLDAPVSGGEQGALDGTLSIMIGGKRDVVERVMPLFECMGKNIVHIGDNGAGQVAKSCNQILVAQSMVAVSEALLLAKSAGVDPAKVREALLGGFAGSKILEVHGLRLLEHNFKPGFKTKLHHKDLRIALENAAALGLALPGAAQAGQYLNALMGAELGELDSAAIGLMVARLNGER
jgi:2-hydroxy-3-oxopropionate reductase